jgi:hypothetical protein
VQVEFVSETVNPVIAGPTRRLLVRQTPTLNYSNAD